MFAPQLVTGNPMLKLDEIKRPIERELDIFEEKFRESMKSSVPLLDRVTH